MSGHYDLSLPPSLPSPETFKPAQKLLKKLQGIMALWLQGSVRGYVLNWRLAKNAFLEAAKLKAGNQKMALKLLKGNELGDDSREKDSDDED